MIGRALLALFGMENELEARREPCPTCGHPRIVRQAVVPLHKTPRDRLMDDEIDGAEFVRQMEGVVK